MEIKNTATGSSDRDMDDCIMVGRSACLQEQRGSLRLADMGAMGTSSQYL